MYQALYRKWRPKTFDDVVGQEHVTTTLKNEIIEGRISHAYLFTGSRGTGKTSCAKILAKAVNCQNVTNANPCGECEACKGIDSGAIMDVLEIDAASNNGVENIRNLKEESNFTPNFCKYRVYIIDEVHMLSMGAFNALLKTLEEPPAHVIFILATTEVNKLPATILSRCQRFDFNRIPYKLIADRLMYIANKEGISLDLDAALRIAGLSDGALRDALSLLDKCIGIKDNISLETVEEVTGIISNKYIFKMSNMILNKEVAGVISLIDELYKSSKNMVNLCQELIEHFRNVMLIKTMNDVNDMVYLPEGDFNNLKDIASKMSLKRVINIMDVLQNGLNKMMRSTNSRTEFEITVIKLCGLEDEVDNSLLERIKKLEDFICNNKISLVSKEPTPKRKQDNNNLKKEDNDKIEELKKDDKTQELKDNAIKMENWGEVLKCLSENSKALAVAFIDSSAYICDNYILIDAKKEIAFTLLRESSKRDEMRLAIEKVTGKKYKLGPYKRTENKELEKEDPLNNLIKTATQAGVKVNIKGEN